MQRSVASRRLPLVAAKSFFNLASGEVFSVICHFVQFLGAKSARSFRHGTERFLQYGQLA
jgi:hypothetical protein